MKKMSTAAVDPNDNIEGEAEVLTREDWACAGFRIAHGGDSFPEVLERPSLSERISAVTGPVARPRVPRASALPPSLWRFINRAQAAAIPGVSVGTFDKMVRAGTMPPAVGIPGHRRKVWDRAQVERACAALSGEPMLAETRVDRPNPWDVVLQ